jgi:hypothetical protein
MPRFAVRAATLAIVEVRGDEDGLVGRSDHPAAED